MKKKLLIRAVYALKDKADRQYEHIRHNAEEVAKINRTLRLHGEAHMAQDLTPQFRELCKKVEALAQNEPAWNANKRLPEILHRVEELETHQAQVNASENIERICKRLNDQDESIESLSETVDQMSSMGPHTCHNLAALKEDRQRIIDLEDAIKVIVRDVDTLKIQMGNTILHTNGLMDEVLKQKAFLAKVEALIQKQVDMKVKPGRVKK
jgi:archaellum component FlaC